ncbi:MAG: ribosome biogenesis/translation initiation ATPase RLI [Thermoplasmatales archaeon]
MHVAVIDYDKCHYKKCRQECQFYCPPVRNNIMAVDFLPTGYPQIHEDLCIGCGICAHRCPFDAIKIIGVPDREKGRAVHRFGKNGFVLYGLPSLEMKGVIGVLGQNGTGKSTILNILTGNLIPNFGHDEAKREKVIEQYNGTYLGEYFESLYSGKKKASLKPQYVDSIPKYFKGKVSDLLSNYGDDGRKKLYELGYGEIYDKDIKNLSGGALQLISILAAVLKDADVYFFDEPSSYLDISQRLKISKTIRAIAEKKKVIVVEHDLAILDFMTDYISLTYGDPRGYGIVSNSYSTRQAINSYLTGYIKQENMKFRDYEIKFLRKPPDIDRSLIPVVTWTDLEKKFEQFTLTVKAGTLRKGQVTGVIGPNSTGKSTFVRMIAGELSPDSGEISGAVKTSFKPQSPESNFNVTVYEFLQKSLGDRVSDLQFKNEILKPLSIEGIGDSIVSELSGGDLQKVYIAKTMGSESDVYVLDEPSAYLDADQRMIVARMIKRFAENNKSSVMVVDHDIYFIDLISTSLIVFSGLADIKGEAVGPLGLRDGMNHFLRNLDITFRRDENTQRPRINKPDSKLDREQRKAQEYYYY